MDKTELGSKTAKGGLQTKKQFVKSLTIGKRIKKQKNGLK
jgi:hypothetical protein